MKILVIILAILISLFFFIIGLVGLLEHDYEKRLYEFEKKNKKKK